MYIQNGVLGIISKIKNKLMNMFSMRVHLFATLFLVSSLSLVFLAIGIINDFKTRNYNNKISDMQEYGEKLSNQIILTGYLSGTNQESINAEMYLMGDIGNGRILIVDENLKVNFDTYSRDTGKAIISDVILRCLKGSGSINRYRKKQYVELTIPIYNSEAKISQGVIIISFTLENVYNLVHTLEVNILIMLITIIVLLFVVALAHSNRMSSPLKEVVKYIEHVSEGYMDENMSVSGYKEVIRISEAHNDMLSYMKRLENSRQEFVSNVSHELKTPMTSIKVLADSLIQQEDAPVELYREFMSDINDEIERENKIINDLLSLVKLDKNSGVMNVSLISINDLLEIILKRLKPIAQKRNIELVLESFRPVSAEVDEVKISIAVSNLIENAIKYNIEDGSVRVSLNADHKYFYIKVADTGIGIPEETQKMIFERFYRVDKARSRQTGGTGLGLAITKSIILMHNGAIKVSSKENEGSTFTMRIPLNYTL